MADFSNHPRFALIDTAVKAFIQRVSDAQALYFTVNNEYFQGIGVPDIIPDGLSNITVNWNVHPQDRMTTWKMFDGVTFASNIKIPFRIGIDVYESPVGWGWVMTFEVWIDGLGPDRFGNYGSHWIYRYHEGPSQYPEEYLNEWFISLGMP